MKLLHSILLFTVLLLFGCSTVTFEEPQPINVKYLKSFPKSLIGLYVGKDMDTLIISHNFFKYEADEKYLITSDLDLELGDAVLKKCKGCYVLSMKSEGEGLWDVVLINQKKTNLHVFGINLEDEEEAVIHRLEKIVTVRVNQEDSKSTEYIIHPTKREFKDIIEKNIFSEVTIFTQIDSQ
ncbi:MAG TPA: hypothetical protein VJ855_01300 [Marinilabiliaceae bacterium]|nr:hypothetical protein [Marinilabiliaceae bacterium]